jgi:ferredoxin-type protein NapG
LSKKRGVFVSNKNSESVTSATAVAEGADGAADVAAGSAAGIQAGAPAISRRSLCVGAGGIAALLALGCVKFVPDQAIVRPPGGQDEAALLAGCIRCEKCVEICPRDVLKLTHIEDGVVAIRTPQMNFYSDYCDFCVEENGGQPLCVDACATGALSIPEGQVATEIILGKAYLETDWCLAYHDTGCHICYDNCPYEAIELDELLRPYVLEDKCNGCGACEATCVSLTAGSRSIAPDATGRAIQVKVQ